MNYEYHLSHGEMSPARFIKILIYLMQGEPFFFKRGENNASFVTKFGEKIFIGRRGGRDSSRILSHVFLSGKSVYCQGKKAEKEISYSHTQGFIIPQFSSTFFNFI